jgi:glyoxylase-like metal-dependent hydrolase (beta-lactamase superfamily II)
MVDRSSGDSGKENSMTKVYAIRTGLVKVRKAQRESKGKGIARTVNMLLDKEWTEWLPIYAWVIEHDEGIILVDTGETSRVHERGYHPSWHPFYRRAVNFSVQPEEELGPQLRAMGIAARDVRQVVLTHLHTDHAGGLAHVTGVKTWVAGEELKRASGWRGRVGGYLPNRWPKWWDPEALRFEEQPLGPFQRSMRLTRRGDVVVIQTPGHTPHHVSVVVQGTVSYFLAGDTSYDQGLLLDGKVDGVSPDEAVSRGTLTRIMALAKERPLVYLPSHDPDSEARLVANAVLAGETSKAALQAVDA